MRDILGEERAVRLGGVIVRVLTRLVGVVERRYPCGETERHSLDFKLTE